MIDLNIETTSYTKFGHKIDYSDIAGSEILVADLIYRLDRIPRFLGDMNWSVRQHSNLTYLLSKLSFSNIEFLDFLDDYDKLIGEDRPIFFNNPKAHIAVLAHDFHEAITGDLPTPFKKWLKQQHNQTIIMFSNITAHGLIKDPITQLQDEIDLKVYDELQIDASHYAKQIKYCDKLAYFIEAALNNHPTLNKYPTELIDFLYDHAHLLVDIYDTASTMDTQKIINEYKEGLCQKAQE